MRVLIDIPDDDIRALDAIARRDGKSRAAVVREAIANYLAVGSQGGFEKYFGLWERHGSTVDGLDYERQLRDEWPDAAPIVPTGKKRSTA